MARTARYLTLLVLVLTAHLALGSVTVMAPATLRAKYDQARFEQRISSFGKVPYGHTIVGVAKTPFPLDACPDSTTVSYTGSDPLILVVQRGTCSFLQKVINAQKLKAAAVLIVNDFNKTLDYVVPFSGEKEAASVRIPSSLINYDEGSYLITDLHFQETEVILAIGYEIKTAETAEVVFRMKANDFTLFETIFAIQTMFPVLTPLVKLVPALDIYPGVATQASTKDCLKNYEACTDSRPEATNKQDKLLFEMLRQACLLVASDNKPDNWRIYASEFYNNCLVKPGDSKQGTYVPDLEKCSLGIIQKKFESLAQAHKTCMGAIGEDNALDPNSQLANYLRINTDYQLMVNSPIDQSVMINGQIMYGEVSTTTVLKEICAGLLHKPEECTKIDKTDRIIVNQTGRFTWAMAIVFLLKMILVGAIIVVGFYLCYKIKLKKDFAKMLNSKEGTPTAQQEADSVLNSYFANKKQHEDHSIDIEEENN